MEAAPMTARQHRLSKGLTIRALAEEADLSTQTIVAIEKGRPARVSSFNAIAEVLRVNVMEIREYRDLVMSQ